jgi:glycosyltransferase involved in cell wall biosynthesis
VHLIIDGYCTSSARLPLVVVGDAPYARSYSKSVRSRADARVRFLGGVWNQTLLNQLYRHCRLYLHGHSVGGTNPSLLRAAGAAAPVAAFETDYNREVMADDAIYFSESEQVRIAVESAEADRNASETSGRRGQERVASRYDWERVTDAYEALCRELVGGRLPHAEFAHVRRRSFRPPGTTP